ncbi:hypothetical protein [Pseudomonas kairouanensis]|uniref:hypothetical protein n=1 Tax=Pseudomonas kairouanensis TaxID=2293832 RepID=UPI001075D0C2|nr:hypothetical protein [Pseudomonas kairouanensis]
MRLFFVIPMLVLFLASAPVSAACLYLTHSYVGILQPKTAEAVYGPFSMTGANGCIGATIDAKLNPTGTGKGIQMVIERLVGSNWLGVTETYGNWALYSGPHGTYRVVLKNTSEVISTYFGTVQYGR